MKFYCKAKHLTRGTMIQSEDKLYICKVFTLISWNSYSEHS